MSETAELPRLTNARFLQIGTKGTIVAGTIHGHPKHPDGKTYYSDPIEWMDGDMVRAGSEFLRFTEKFN